MTNVSVPTSAVPVSSMKDHVAAGVFEKAEVGMVGGEVEIGGKAEGGKNDDDDREESVGSKEEAKAEERSDELSED